MARQKTFDPERALDAALDLFWRQGYEATSMAELQEAMGIGRQSLYDTYGDKHELFLKALARYTETNSARMQRILGSEGPVVTVLRDYFDTVAHMLTPAGERPACLVTNTILERSQHDGAVAEVCRRNERSVVKSFEQVLRRAVEGGEISPLEDPHSAALFLASTQYGMGVLAKNGASRRRLQEVARRALGAVGVEVEAFVD